MSNLYEILFQMRSTDSIDSGFHSLNIGVGGQKQRMFYKTSLGSSDNYCEMVRYNAGRRQEIRGPGGARSRSKSRDRRGHRQQRYSVTDTYNTPMIADYLNNPMFDVLHHKQRERCISLLSRPSGGGRRGSYWSRTSSSASGLSISTCKVL